MLLLFALPSCCARRASTGLTPDQDYCGPIVPASGGASASRVSGLDCGGLQSPAILFDGGRYKMWFTCGDSIAFSSSTDGDHWSSPVTITLINVPRRARLAAVFAPTVIKVGNANLMWFTARDSTDTLRIELAGSNNDIAWFFVGQPTASNQADTLFKQARDPFVLFENGIFTMWFVNERPPHALMRSTSTNATFWTTPLPSLVPLAGWEAGGVGSPTILETGGQFHLWYQGWNANRSV